MPQRALFPVSWCPIYLKKPHNERSHNGPITLRALIAAAVRAITALVSVAAAPSALAHIFAESDLRYYEIASDNYGATPTCRATPPTTFMTGISEQQGVLRPLRLTVTGRGRKSETMEPVRERTVGSDSERRADAELLAATRLDPEAFSVFYNRHFDNIITYFWRRIRDRDVAADLTAETFAAALEPLHRFDPDKGNPSQWLYGIAANLLKKFWRTRSASDRARTGSNYRRPRHQPTGGTVLKPLTRTSTPNDSPLHSIGCRHATAKQFDCECSRSSATSRSRNDLAADPALHECGCCGASDGCRTSSNTPQTGATVND